MNPFSLRCDCIPQLADFVGTCVVSNGSGIVYRTGTKWIGTTGNGTNLAYYEFCPFDYCEVGSIGVDLYSSDSQCALNHSGVLCGGCPPGLSLAIGSSRCIYCPENSHVALLLVFMIAGIALVLFMI